MKSLFLFFALAIFAIRLLPAQNIPQPTHILLKTANTSTDSLRNSLEFFHFYNNNGHLYQTNSNTWWANAWKPDEKIFYSLNTNGKPAMAIRRAWLASSSAYYDVDRTNYGYQLDGQENFRKIEGWNEITNLWMPDEEISQTFSLSNKPETYTRKLFDHGIQWYGIQNNYTYNNDGQRLETLAKNWNGSLWTDSVKIVYFYNGSNEDYTRSYSSKWNSGASNWWPADIRDSQIVTTNQRIVFTEKLLTNIWTPYVKSTSNFTTDNQISDNTYEKWSISDSNWVTELKLEYVYNNDQSLSQIKGFARDYQKDILYNYFVEYLDYGLYPVSTYSPALKTKVKISPNPVDDFVRVEVEGKAESSITLLDVYGNVVSRTTTSSNTATISLASQAAGAYFIQVKQGGAFKLLPVIKN